MVGAVVVVVVAFLLAVVSWRSFKESPRDKELQIEPRFDFNESPREPHFDVRSSLRGTHEMELNVHQPPRHATAFSDPSRAAVTVTTHMSVDRFAELQRWCWEWLGPMSVSLFAASQEQGRAIVREMVRRDICIANYVALHVTWCTAERREPSGEQPSVAQLFDRAKLRGLAPREPTAPGLCGKYPFNLQRNVAIEGSDDRSDWVFIVDMDLHLMPLSIASSSDFAAHLLATASAPALSRLAPAPTAWVVAAVETKHSLSPLPLSISELRNGVAERWVFRFYPGCPNCYWYPNVTNFAEESSAFQEQLSERGQRAAGLRWLESPAAAFPYHEGMEPFLALRLKGLIPFDDAFVGRHMDKVAVSFALSAAGYRFHVLPVAYLVNIGPGDNPRNPTPDELWLQEMNAYHYVLLKDRAMEAHPELVREISYFQRQLVLDQQWLDNTVPMLQHSTPEEIQEWARQIVRNFI